jgi:hypothetical protein
MDKRYQVFVSSTYEDLREERREVMLALLALDCIPTGMELFPAADEDSWTHIKRFIAGCDYYIVIIGGRYGSRGSAGISYTEMEYDYAIEVGLPALAFLHQDPGTIPANRTEPTDDGRTALEAFREKIHRTRHAKYWKSPEDLAGKVTLSMVSLMKIKPRVGLVRSDLVPDEGVAQELLRLRREIDSLNGDLAIAKSKSAPEDLEYLAQGSDTTTITIGFEGFDQRLDVDVRWDSLIRAILPQTIGGGAPPEAVAAAISSLVQGAAAGSGHPGWKQTVVSRSDYGKVLNQMVALGLIEGRCDPANALGTRWYATPYGIQAGSRLVAVRRAQPA